MQDIETESFKKIIWAIYFDPLTMPRFRRRFNAEVFAGLLMETHSDSHFL